MKLRYCLLLLVVLCSCSSGHDIDESSFNLPDEPTQELREVFRTSEPIDGEFFLFIWKINVLSNGNLIVHDMRHTQLYELTPEGDLVTVIGREGRGPGEFMQITYTHVLGNDSLHVFDPTNSRHQVFVKNEENEWEYSRERYYRLTVHEELRGHIPENVIVGPDDINYGIFLLNPTSLGGRASDTLAADYKYVARVDNNMMHIDDVNRLKLVRDRVTHRDKSGRGGVSYNKRLLHAYYNYDPVRDEVIYITNASNEIIAIDSAGIESVKGYLPYDRFPADQAAIEESLTFWDNRVEGIKGVIRPELLNHEPYYWNVTLAENRLWVQLARTDEIKPNWVITSLDGTVLESFHGPVDISNISAMAINGNRFYGSIEDADGAEYLVGYELVDIGE